MISPAASLHELYAWLQTRTRSSVEFDLLNPDLASHRHNGERVTCQGRQYRYHSYRALVDLAESLACRMLTPRVKDECTVTITFEPLDMRNTFHDEGVSDRSEKYGSDSAYACIQKAEEPAILHAYLQALDNVHIKKRHRILNLGVNRGDEFDTIRTHIGANGFDAQTYVGIDHSRSATLSARGRFGENVTFHVCDINAIDTLRLPPFDLIISIGTLQSPGIEMKPLVMKLAREYLEKEAAMILGFPNCRWVDGEMLYGAKAPNYSFSEQSLLYNDVMFCKRYLQQHKFRVTLTGKQYLFLTATKIGLDR